MAETLAVDRQGIGMFAEKLYCEAEHVVEIERVRIAFLLSVGGPYLFQLLFPIEEIRILLVEQFFELDVRVRHQTEHGDEHVGLGESAQFRIDIAGGYNRIHQGFLIVAIEDGEGFRKADLIRVAAEDAVAD